MSNFGLSCDVCNRKNVGITWVNGMKFCAKCYQETFGNQKKYVDMLHKETGELLVNLLAEKDKQIAELQKQLEEKEKYTYTGKEVGEIERKYDEKIDTLEQKLKSQPAEIVEKIRNICCIEDKCKNGSFVLGINEKDLDTILEEYQKINNL